MTSILRAGVIGAGVFGGYHAAKYAEMPDVALTSVFDTHPERAAALAGRFDARAQPDLTSFLDAVDIVSIAAPASRHGALAVAVLNAGRPVYVEKPLATDLEDGDAIALAAARQNLVVACGFLERAAFAAMGLFHASRRPLRMEATRLGTASPRNLDVSVVIDLMIHDLDLALALDPSDPLAVEAEGVCVVNEGLDETHAEVVFEDGFVARFRASRVAPARERTLILGYSDGEVRLDLLGHRFENTTSLALNAAYEDDPRSRDRLGASLAAFVGAVRDRGARPLADVTDGLRALDLALAVERAAGG